MKDARKEKQLSIVAIAPEQDREVRSRWAWTEPAVWTDRMLTALETGVRGGVWFNLIDKVFSPRNLRAAWDRVRRNDGAAGTDRQSVEQFGAQAEKNLQRLHEELREERYQPGPVRRQWIPKMGTAKLRPLGIPNVRDRVVQTALRNVLEPIFERRFTKHSYGFRPGRGCKDAVQRVDELLAQGFTWVVDADIQSYFDTIPKPQLMEEVRKEVADGRVLKLVERFLEQSVMEGVKSWTPEKGTPQGAVISPLLANVYLHPVDEAMQAAGYEIVRYADDLVVLCNSEKAAVEALKLLDALMKDRGLTLHPEKTRVVNYAHEGFEFLGYRFENGRKYPRQKSRNKLNAAIRELTPRNNGKSLREIITCLNAVLRGWFEYFKPCFKRTFDIVDGFVRRRLRAVLLRRRKRSRRGIGLGMAHREYPNAFFANEGLFSTAAAYRTACQSP